MANLKFLSTSKIRASEIIADTKTYIGRVYGRLGDMFTTASPFSQILEVLSEISELLFFYVEDATVEQNILTAQHPESIYGLARLTGHDAFRGASAIGEIAIRLNTSSKNDISGDALIIPANTVIKSNSNGIPYTLRTNSDLFRIEKSNSNYIFIPIIQGVLESQTVTGTGLELQSFNIITKQTDHDNVTVTVNGEKWEKFDSIYDMKANSKGYLIKTGLSNGLDLYFGNGSFGMIPPTGSTIKIDYFISRGSVGNLNHSKDLTFKFQNEGVDSVGNSHNLNDVLEVKCTVAPIMGADPEDLAMTKLIAPLASKSFVLATPDHYEYFLSRYGMFSYLDAYNSTDDGYLDDDNVIYLFMLPDTKRKLTKNQDYFTIPVDEFFFSQDEKNGIYNVLEKSGQQMVTTEVKIVDPVVKKFRIDVKVRYFENYSKAEIFNLIRSKISEYLLNITRRDRLPKSDLIAILESIEGIDSVNVRFVSQKEEEARARGYYTVETVTVTPSTPTLETVGNGQQKYVFFKRTVNTSTVNIAPNDPLPESVIGLDSFGDIILGKNEVALFRGGWNDRDGSVVSDGAKLGEQAALSVYFDEPAVPNTIYTRIQTQNRKNL